MSRVFLSYKKIADGERASVVRTKLEELGMDVFQDVDMSAGVDYHRILHEQISLSTAVLVLWTENSIKSRWVSAEAQKGLDLEKLVAVTFDRIIPRDMRMPFNGVQSADLSDWIETGAKADHPSWQSVLKALGVLFGRPFPEIADIVAAGTLDSKANYIRKYPSDPFSAGLIQELKAAKLHDFEQQANRVKHVGEKRLSDEVRQLNQLRGKFANLVTDALANGTYDRLDVKQEIHKALNPNDTDPSSDVGLAKRGRKVLVEEIARMRSEINLLRDSKTSAESAQAEITGTAAQLSSQLEDTKGKLLDFQNLSEQTKAEIDSQKLKIADLEKRGQQTRRPAAWLIVVSGVILGAAGVMWFASGNSNLADEERQKLQGKLDVATKQLDTVAKQLESSNADKDSLLKENKRLSDQTKKLDAATNSLSKDTKQLSDQLDEARTKLITANNNVNALGTDKKQLQDQLDEARTKLITANNNVNALGTDKKQLVDQLNEARTKLVTANNNVNALGTDKKQLMEQLNDAKTKLDTATSAVSASQSANAARAVSEARCNELAAYGTDPDLPADAKYPSKTPFATAPDIIDACLAALGSTPKETSRRILLQLSRGYILQGHASREKDQPSATTSYSAAISLAELASRLGSTQADMILGYIFGGGFNVPKFKYVLPNTPDYSLAWKKIEPSAIAKNPFAMLYAGSYLVWPGCSQSQIYSVPDQGLQYLRLAQAKKVAAAYYAEGYYWYFGVPGVKSEPQRALDLFDKAKKLNFAEADAFLGKSPPKPDSCPRAVFF